MSDAVCTVRAEIEICAAHRLLDYQGKCSRLHGHNYRIEVKVCARVQSNGISVDFGRLKNALNTFDKLWDHRTLLRFDDPLKDRVEDAAVLCPANPTAENMAKWVADGIADGLPEALWVQVKVWETSKHYAESEVVAGGNS